MSRNFLDFDLDEWNEELARYDLAARILAAGLEREQEIAGLTEDEVQARVREAMEQVEW